MHYANTVWVYHLRQATTVPIRSTLGRTKLHAVFLHLFLRRVIRGATRGPAEYQPETAETSDKSGVITSGGGFSDFYAQPSWMSEAIASYMETVDPKPTGPFNSFVRGYPDVSMVGKNSQTTIGGFTRGVSGTSESAPVVAGMIALVNAERIKAGNNAIGFILPALYQNNWCGCTSA